MTNDEKFLKVVKRIDRLRRKIKELEKEKEKLEAAVNKDRVNKVTRLRRERNMSLDRLAERVSVSVETLIGILKGEGPSSKEVRVSIAESLGVDCTELWSF